MNLIRDQLVGIDSCYGTVNCGREEDLYPPVARSADGRFRLPADTGIDWRFEAPDTAELVALRREHALEDVVAGARGDFDAALRLCRWVKSKWDHDTYAEIPDWNARHMLQQAAVGVGYYCVHYVVCFVQVCQAVGLAARIVNIHPAVPDRTWAQKQWSGPTPYDEHCVAEVWCSDLDKWVLVDPDFDLYYRSGEDILSALEVHRAWVEDRADQIAIATGPGTADMEALIAPDTLARWYRHYQHIVVFARNNHLSDPDGPTQVVHWTDDHAPPLIYWDGSDMRHWPGILGPSWAGRADDGMTALLTDGDLDTAWASSDDPVPHWAEARLPRPALLDEIVLTWPIIRGSDRPSRRLTMQGLIEDRWEDLNGDCEGRRGATSLRPRSVQKVAALRILQDPGGGHAATPNRLWLAQIEIRDDAPPA